MRRRIVSLSAARGRDEPKGLTMTTVPFATYTAAGNELSNGMDERAARAAAAREVAS